MDSVYLSGGLEFSRSLDKYTENEFDLSGGLGFSRPLDKYLESKFDLSSGLGFSRPLDKHPVYELRGAEPAQPAQAACLQQTMMDRDGQ